MAATTYSYWRFWPPEGDSDQVRVARDRYINGGSTPHPEHLEEGIGGKLRWGGHRQGAVIPSVALSAFTAYLDQGGR